MSKRIGYVVAVHPEDHSMDVVMADDGTRLTGVQMLSHSASERSGTVDMPYVPEKKNKWDIGEKTGQDMKVAISYAGRTPIVDGFLHPQINQILQSDPKMRYSRHTSDVEHIIDGDGNIQVRHPSGAYIRIGEETEMYDSVGKNVDKNSQFDRNTDRKVSVHVELAGQKVQLTLGKDGNVSIKLKGAINIESDGEATIKASKVTVDADELHCKKKLIVDGETSLKDNVQVTGNLTATGSITDGDGDGGA